MSIELMIFRFPTVTGADDMVKLLKSFQAQHFVDVYAGVVAVKYDEQHIDVRHVIGAGPGKGTAAGALTGALIGLPGGPAGAAIGLAAGALVGGAVEAAQKPGAQSEEFKSLARYELRSGESALLVYADSLWSSQIEQMGKDVDTVVYRRSTIQYADAGAVEGIQIYKSEIEESRKEQLVRVYASWEDDLAQARVELAALRERAKVATQAGRAEIQEQIAKANAKLGEFYQNMLHTLDVRRQQIDAEISRLEAQVKQANAQRKAEIEQRLAAAREANVILRAQIKTTLTAQLDDLKADLASLKAQVAQIGSESRAVWKARVATLEKDLDAEQKRLAQLDEAHDAAWNEMSRSIDQAITTYRKALRQAEEDYYHDASASMPQPVETPQPNETKTE